MVIALATFTLGACAGAGGAEPASDPVATGAATPASGGTVGGLGGQTTLQPGTAPQLADLVLPDGSAFELSSLAGAPVLVFFGYSHCPDVCPATLSELFGVIEAEPETQALFVSVDPERDTPAFLAEWTAYLPSGFHALTGSPGAVRRAADAWGVRYARVETTSTAGYTMSHTADVFLLDGEGTLQQVYPFGTKAEAMVAGLRALQPA